MQTTVGPFTTLSWFRSVRVPHFHLARAAADTGRVVDSYYDIVMARYIDADDMEWLIQRDDPYFPVIREMARLDSVMLPKADVVVFFKVSMGTWKQLIDSRRRDLDASVFPRAFAFQEPLIRALREEAARSGTRVVTFEPVFGSIDEAAKQVGGLLDSHVNKTCSPML
jgi:hypothetical protein